MTLPAYIWRIKKEPYPCMIPLDGRDDWIRTSGPYVPNVVLYQTEPHPVNKMAEEVGFEPTSPFGLPHFECGPL